MPNLMGVVDVDAQKTLSNFEFSGKRVDKLGATEYTLVSIQVDTSGSIAGFQNDLVQALKNIVGACEKSPRAENMLVRVTTFSDGAPQEIHGFVPLADIKTTKYDTFITAAGGTALYDASMDALECTKKYSEGLVDMDYNCNAIVFVVTDGEENSSRIGTPRKILNLVDKIRLEEKLESMKIVLVGVGDQNRVQQALADFQTQAKLDQFVWIGEATPTKLAKLAEFISKSISSTSQALGTGGVSQDISF